MAELSPKAQAVLDAITFISPAPADEIAAAALCAAADQVVPDDGVASSIERIVEKRIRAELRAIAAEMEGTDAPR